MIQTESSARRSLLNGVNILANIVKTTLGPDGSTVILHTPEGKAYTTKDGVSVARKVFDNDMMVDAGIQLVREGTAKTADEVGDGPQPLYAKVLTPNGWKSMGELKVGDTICGTGGTIQYITGVFPKGEKEIYNVHFSNGRIVECCADHVWTVTNGHNHDISQNLTVKEMLNKGVKGSYIEKSTNKLRTAHFFYTPKTSVDFYKSKEEQYLHPYIVGLLLGDGSLSGTGNIELSLALGQEDVIEKVNNLLPSGIRATFKKYEDRHYLRVVLKGKHDGISIRKYIDKLGLLGTKSDSKFIPKQYLYAPKEDRLQLLEGLLDSDGHINSRGLIEYSTVSTTLKEDVAELLNGLGYFLNIRLKNRHKTKGAYSGSKPIWTIFQLAGFKNGDCILDIEKTGKTTQMQCIKVSNPDELYITDNYIVTHNTTSSTVLAQSLINQCMSLIENRECTAQTLKREMNEALEDIVERLKSHYSYPVELEEDKLTNIATISANNDKELGSLIAKAFIEAGKDGIVLFDKSTTDKTEIECTQGMRIDSELLSPAFINNPRSQTAEYEKRDVSVQVLLIDNIVKNIQELAQSTLRIAISQGAPVLLVAHDFTPAVLKEIIQNNLRNNTQILPIKADGFGVGKTECLKDIAAATEAVIFDDTKNANAQGFGHCDKVIVSKYNTTIVTSLKIDSAKLDERVNALKARIEEETDAFNKKKLQEKLAKLIGKMVIIHVGGITESVAKEKYDRVEDAVYAVRAALEEGYSIGGGMTYLNIFKDFADKSRGKGYSIVLNALTAPFVTLYKNTYGEDATDLIFKELFTYASNYGYNFSTRNIEDLEEAGVIDPTKVLRVALENAVAVTCLIISTSGIITGE